MAKDEKQKPVSTFANDHLVLYLFIPIDVWVSHSVMCADRFVSLSPSNSGFGFHYYVCILCEAKLIGLTLWATALVCTNLTRIRSYLDRCLCIRQFQSMPQWIPNAPPHPFAKIRKQNRLNALFEISFRGSSRRLTPIQLPTNLSNELFAKLLTTKTKKQKKQNNHRESVWIIDFTF